MKRPFFVVIVTVLLFIFACNQSVKVEVVTESSMRDSTQLVFWKNLGDLYGKAFRGTVVAGAEMGILLLQANLGCMFVW